MFMPGPLELLIIALILLVPLLAVVGVVVAVVASRSRGGRPAGNLIPCPDCGRMVSPHAVQCPQCGRPMQVSSFPPGGDSP